MTNSGNSDDCNSDREEFRRLLLQISNGSLADPIMSVPVLLPYLFQFRYDRHDDPSYFAILAIDSDLREFPLDPKFRARCHPDFLASKDRELADLKIAYHDSLIAACKTLLENDGLS